MKTTFKTVVLKRIKSLTTKDQFVKFVNDLFRTNEELFQTNRFVKAIDDHAKSLNMTDLEMSERIACFE